MEEGTNGGLFKHSSTINKKQHLDVLDFLGRSAFKTDKPSFYLRQEEQKFKVSESVDGYGLKSISVVDQNTGVTYRKEEKFKDTASYQAVKEGHRPIKQTDVVESYSDSQSNAEYWQKGKDWILANPQTGKEEIYQSLADLNQRLQGFAYAWLEEEAKVKHESGKWFLNMDGTWVQSDPGMIQLWLDEAQREENVAERSKLKAISLAYLALSGGVTDTLRNVSKAKAFANRNDSLQNASFLDSLNRWQGTLAEVGTMAALTYKDMKLLPLYLFFKASSNAKVQALEVQEVLSVGDFLSRIKIRSKLKKHKTSSKASIPLNQNILIGAGVGGNAYQGILRAHIAPGDVKIYNVGAGNGVIVKSQTNIGDGINLPRGVHVNWMIDMGSSGDPTYFNAGNRVDYTANEIIALKNDIRDQFCPNGLNENNYGVIVVTHPDLDHYKWIPQILDLCYEQERTRPPIALEAQINQNGANPPFNILAKPQVPVRAGWAQIDPNNANNAQTRNLLRDYLYWVFPETYSNENIITHDFFSDANNAGLARRKLLGYLPILNNFNDRRIRFDLFTIRLQALQNSFYFVNMGWNNGNNNIIGNNVLPQGHDKNRRSIIMRLRPQNDINAVLITGDATGDTLTDMLVSDNNGGGFNLNNQFNLLDINHAGQIRTLLAPHHGAETDGSNLLPGFVSFRNDADIIYSAGRSYGHPKCSSIALANGLPINLLPPFNPRALKCSVNGNNYIDVNVGKDIHITTELDPLTRRFNR